MFLFRGTSYTTNGAGDIVATPITEQTLLADRAAAGGITDLSTVAIVYHGGGDTGNHADTGEIVNSSTGAKLANEFAFLFGSDSTLQRTAVTNATRTA